MRAFTVFVTAHDASMLDMLCSSIQAERSLALAGRCGAAEDAVALAADAQPDVVALDMQLPGADCLKLIGELRASCGAPVVAMSAVTGIALATLNAGADDFVYMPVGGSDSDYGRFLADATDRIKLAAASGNAAKSFHSLKAEDIANTTGRRLSLVAVAASAGGPVPLACLISRLPQDGPAVLCVQWRDGAFGTDFAGMLSDMVKRKVTSGYDGMALSPGDVVIVCGNSRATVTAANGKPALGIRGVCRSREEQADALFASVADALGDCASGVMLSGGAVKEGLKKLAEAGAKAIRLNKNAILKDAGYSAGEDVMELPLEDIAAEIG